MKIFPYGYSTVDAIDKEFVLAARTKSSRKSVAILSNVSTLIAVLRAKNKRTQLGTEMCSDADTVRF